MEFESFPMFVGGPRVNLKFSCKFRGDFNGIESLFVMCIMQNKKIVFLISASAPHMPDIDQAPPVFVIFCSLLPR